MSRQPKQTRQIRLTVEGLVFLLVLGFITVGAVLRNVNLLILMAGLMFAPLLINWRVGVLRLKTLAARRVLPHQMHAKELLGIQWVCQNESSSATWNISIHDQIEKVVKDDPEPPGFRLAPEKWWMRLMNWFGFEYRTTNSDQAKIDFVKIGARQSEATTYRVFFPQRGSYLIGPSLISSRFPFGLMVSQIFESQQQPFFVAPALGNLTANWERRLRSMEVGADAVMRKRGLEQDEFFALRPWRSGDSKKQIHWRSTARQGQPIVKQHDQPDNRDFAMLIDLSQPSEGRELGAGLSEGQAVAGDAEFPSCETLLSFAATVVLHLGVAVQGRVAVGICGQETAVCRGRNHRELVKQFLQKLAVARPSSGHSHSRSLTELVLELAGSVSANTPIYIFSTRERPAGFGQQLGAGQVKREASSQAVGDLGTAAAVGGPEANALDLNRETDSPPQPAAGLSPDRNALPASRAAARIASQLNAIVSAVRWVSVDSDSFNEIFQASTAGQSLACTTAQKWMSENASR